MYPKRSVALAVTILCAVLGCSRPGDRGAPSPEQHVSFVNRVWKVAESITVAAGQLYVFLSEGTLVIASSSGKPSLGSWSQTDGALTMVEESIPYKVDILGLSEDEFRIRVHNPGQPVEIRLVPAEETRAATTPRQSPR